MRYLVVIILILVAANAVIKESAAYANTSCNPKYEKCGW